MKRIKVIIVDDEKLARNRIRKLLTTDEEIHIVNEFSSGKEAISFIQNHHIDIVYLDIHMPEIDGFSVLSEISDNNRPFIIFATADNASALKAYELKALDYLLKPFRNSRFYESLENAKQYVLQKRNAQLGEKFVDLARTHKEKKPTKLKINAMDTIDYDDIIFIQSDGNYLKLFKDKSKYHHIRKTLNEISLEIDNTIFIRIHRSIIVNSYFITSVNYIGNNEYEFLLSSEIKLQSSRSYKEKITQFLDSSIN